MLLVLLLRYNMLLVLLLLPCVLLFLPLPLHLAGCSCRLGTMEGQMPGHKVVATGNLLLPLAICCTRCLYHSS